jgi:hypothetical protein
MLQRSDEWFEARLGRFTASDSDRLVKAMKILLPLFTWKGV